jgi:chemotaxis protein methyltransferase CheR
MPHLHRGLLARRAGEIVTARRELGLALALVECEDDARIRLYGGGFNREGLLQLCRAELGACRGER